MPSLLLCDLSLRISNGLMQLLTTTERNQTEADKVVKGIAVSTQATSSGQSLQLAKSGAAPGDTGSDTGIVHSAWVFNFEFGIKSHTEFVCAVMKDSTPLPCDMDVKERKRLAFTDDIDFFANKKIYFL